MALDHVAFGFRGAWFGVFGRRGFRISGFKVARRCAVAHGGEFFGTGLVSGGLGFRVLSGVS